jgi:hypothetical protein
MRFAKNDFLEFIFIEARRFVCFVILKKEIIILKLYTVDLQTVLIILQLHIHFKSICVL